MQQSNKSLLEKRVLIGNSFPGNWFFSLANIAVTPYSHPIFIPEQSFLAIAFSEFPKTFPQTLIQIIPIPSEFRCKKETKKERIIIKSSNLNDFVVNSRVN